MVVKNLKTFYMNSLHNFNFPDPPARIHLVGIKGQAMTGLAQLLKGHGYQITGSDVADVFTTDAVLKTNNITVFEGFDHQNITSDVNLVIYSTAYNTTHPELVEAASRGIPYIILPVAQQFLLSLAKQRVCVAGSHGKTTTTAMLSLILTEANLNPTALVGAPVAAWHANARMGADDIFVLEADEYQNKFQYYDATEAIVTNVDYDHPDVYANSEVYLQAFKDFVRKMPATGLLLLNADDVNTPSLISETDATVQTFGVTESATWRLANLQFVNHAMSFDLFFEEKFLTNLTLAYPGLHYAMDAVAALAMSIHLGADLSFAKRALAQYRGTSRRLEIIGHYNGALVLDDYAHHPTEMRATIDAIKQAYHDKRLILIFEPHTFSRTEALLTDFAKVLATVDKLYLPPIFASAREKRGTVTPEFLATTINQLGGHAVAYASFADILADLKSTVQETDVVLTMGAGDVWHIAHDLVQ